jgi:hypothetical protein
LSWGTLVGRLLHRRLLLRVTFRIAVFELILAMPARRKFDLPELALDG